MAVLLRIADVSSSSSQDLCTGARRRGRVNDRIYEYRLVSATAGACINSSESESERNAMSAKESKIFTYP